MGKEPGGGFGIAVAAFGMVLCCALLVLVASGGLSVLAAWLFDGGLVWLGAVVLALVAGGVLLRHRLSADKAKRSGGHSTGEVP